MAIYRSRLVFLDQFNEHNNIYVPDNLLGVSQIHLFRARFVAFSSFSIVLFLYCLKISSTPEYIWLIRLMQIFLKIAFKTPSDPHKTDSSNIEFHISRKDLLLPDFLLASSCSRFFFLNQGKQMIAKLLCFQPCNRVTNCKTFRLN